MRAFRLDDCSDTRPGIPIINKVVLLKDQALPVWRHGQLFFCMGGAGAVHGTGPGAVFLVSLLDGERCRCSRSEVAGILKPELLPEDAKLQLSQIRPFGAADLASNTPEYSGYSFLPDGRYAAGVWLCSPEEVKCYVEMQKNYQHRVLICDRDDFAVMEIVEGKLVFPDEQTLREYLEGQEPDGGMAMT